MNVASTWNIMTQEWMHNKPKKIEIKSENRKPSMLFCPIRYDIDPIDRER